MNLEALRARGERQSEELARESYRAGAGLSDTTDFAGIVARYPELASDEALDAARGHRALREWVADNIVGRATAPLEDRLQAWESRAEVVVAGGERVPFQRVSVLIANEPDRARRLMLDAARRAVLAEPAALRAEKLAVERELLARFGNGGGVVAARSALSGIDLDTLGAAAGAVLARTADLYRDVLRERLRSVLGLTPGDAVRSDASWLFRGAAYDDAFAATDLVPTARRQVAAMGLDAEAGGRIVFDTGERERKRARAFCAPVRVPDEVYLVIRPFGGYVDWRAFWHELGHALHFGHVARDLPFEHRWLGDNSVTEAFAMLFEHTTGAPAWLARYTSLEGERRRAFLREQAFTLLAVVRRYAAKLRYELALHRAPSFAAGAAGYVETLTEATGFRYDAEDALLDLDDGFYAARYLRAWQLEAMLRGSLRDRFDEDWFRNPRTGPVLQGLFARGQRDDAAVLAAADLGGPLSFDTLVEFCEAALA